MTNKTFTYEIVSLDTGWFAVLKFKLFNKRTFIVHGQYDNKAKALLHLNGLFNDGHWLINSKTRENVL